jgi:hypothetical protein
VLFLLARAGLQAALMPRLMDKSFAAEAT